jgi:hypothetical protein
MAQQNTGSMPNTGFLPVGTWEAAKPLQTYEKIESIALKVKSCIENSQ